MIGQKKCNFCKLTSTPVDEIGPYNLALREAEYTQPASTKLTVVDIPRIRLQGLALVDLETYQANLGSMKKLPPIGCFGHPANVVRVGP